LTLKTQSNRIEKLSDEKWRITGELTIRDVTKEVVLETEFEGQIKDAYGKQRAAFAAETAVSLQGVRPQLERADRDRRRSRRRQGESRAQRCRCTPGVKDVPLLKSRRHCSDVRSALAS